MRQKLNALWWTTYHKVEQERRHDVSTMRDALLVGLMVCISLLGTEYFGRVYYFEQLLSHLGSTSIQQAMSPNQLKLLNLSWWAGILFLFYVLLPAILIKGILKKSFSEIGLSWRFTRQEGRLFFLILFMVIPVVFVASYSTSFQQRYPFFTIQHASEIDRYFLLWEILYAFQFFAVEFFFRGFFLHGMKKAMGMLSILVMTIPYCMIHFCKPMPEAFGAILAGLLLGMLSLKFNSIGLGVGIHITVAYTMDFASLWQKGIL